VPLFYIKDSGVWDIFHISDDLPYLGHINANVALGKWSEIGRQACATSSPARKFSHRQSTFSERCFILSANLKVKIHLKGPHLGAKQYDRK
jgi:hypothetical protein